jgi:hypothetical protein
MLVLTEEAYAQATGSSPYRNAGEGMVSGTEAIKLAGGGTAPGGGATGHLIDILPLAKLILHKSSVRKSMLVSG